MKTATRKRGLISAIALFCASLVSSAFADELAGGDAPFHIVAISREACDNLAIYIPNGEADYKPGVAADGSTVAPADVDGGYGIAPRASYSFPVTIDPFRGQSAQFSAHTEMDVAQVVIDPSTGRVTVDGQDVSGADRALAEACAQQKDNSAH